MNVFIRAIVRIFSLSEKLILPLNSAIASLNGTINLSPHENILTIALINIYYLYIIYRLEGPDGKMFCRGLSFLEAKFVLQNEDSEICFFTWQTFVICEAIIELVVDKIISSLEIIFKAQVSG